MVITGGHLQLRLDTIVCAYYRFELSKKSRPVGMDKCWLYKDGQSGREELLQYCVVTEHRNNTGEFDSELRTASVDVVDDNGRPALFVIRGDETSNGLKSSSPYAAAMYAISYLFAKEKGASP